MKYQIITLLSFSLILNFVSSKAMAELNQEQIVNHTLKAAPNCMRVHQVGQCFFKHPQTGQITTTTEWSMFIPDLTVAVYNEPGDIPIENFKKQFGIQLKKALSEQFTNQLVGGGPLMTTQGRTQTFFKEVGVYGNPTALIGQVSAEYLCPSNAQAMKAYYQSELDAIAWRQATASTTHPFTRTVGLTNQFGLLLPLHGFVTSSSAEWASAVIAERSTHLVTGAPDKLLPVKRNVDLLPLTCGQKGLDGTSSCETFPVEENNSKRAQWQVLHPNVGQQCAQFDHGILEPNMVSATDSKQSLVINLWHCYRCCTPAPGLIFVGKKSAIPANECAL